MWRTKIFYMRILILSSPCSPHISHPFYYTKREDRRRERCIRRDLPRSKPPIWILTVCWHLVPRATRKRGGGDSEGLEEHGVAYWSGVMSCLSGELTWRLTWREIWPFRVPWFVAAMHLSVLLPSERFMWRYGAHLAKRLMFPLVH